jgi:hypothetical protein
LAETVNRISTILATNTNLHLQTKDILTLACASTTISPTESICVLFNERISKDVATRTQELSLDDHEMNAIFGERGITQSTTMMVEMVKNPQFRTYRDKLQDSLRATLRYEPRAVAWAQTHLQCAAVMSLFMTNPVHRISGIIGDIITSDIRWIEDLCAEIEDEGVSPFVLVTTTRVLIDSIGF